MTEIQKFKNADLILKVNSNYDPTKLKLDNWDEFLERLCEGREYQQEAIRNAIIFLVGGKYQNTESLVEENYENNVELQKRYRTLDDYKSKLQIQNKVFANIDLATGTGKSYVIYGIAQIMLGLGFVDRVLVLCPSVTIENELMNKFLNLSGGSSLRKCIPEDAIIKNPSIIDANTTIKKGCICVENIHSVYENTGSSIYDSLNGNGERTLILNDESHHIFNKSGDKYVKKWKDFLISDIYKFKYMIGFTGTAYIDNEYFNDVIYRYSLKQAIEDRIVKNIDYVSKDNSLDINQRFQKIYKNHKDNIDSHPKVKPLTILITQDIKKAKQWREELIDFLEKQEKLPVETIEEKVLIVTSHNDHRANIIKLKSVDDKDNKVEWIVSVSMLTEGWDVKNVFQIVPCEDRAFNSKLLISQVLGRGLRLPEEYESPQPRVIVFNHDAWSRSIKGLVDEILEIEKRISSEILKSGDRNKYNFTLYNLNYDKENKEVKEHKNNEKYNFSRIEKEGIKLTSQVIEAEQGTTFTSVTGNNRDKNYLITYETKTIYEVIDKIYDTFETTDWEGRILQLKKDEYTKNDLPKRKRIEKLIRKSMKTVGIEGDLIIEDNANKIFSAFGTLLRKKGKTIIIETKVNDFILINTINMQNDSMSIGNLKKDSTVFYTNNYKNEIENKEQKIILEEVIGDDNLRKDALKEKNEYLFKTPLNVCFANGKPERDFIDTLCRKENAEKIDAWIKSRDMCFYPIDYTFRRCNHQVRKEFNPDFFIKVGYCIFVVEIKENGDRSDENRAKYKYGKEHFRNINEKLKEQKSKEKYFFHFLSPDSYVEFFDYLRNDKLKDGFRSKLENLLEEAE
jgi:type III restriction enzyme